jgi:hypothetical protein
VSSSQSLTGHDVAVSPESITASAPSITELLRRLLQLVGVKLVIIVPSFGVATITGILAIFALRINSFEPGTSCAGSSTLDLHERPSSHHNNFISIFSNASAFQF